MLGSVLLVTRLLGLHWCEKQYFDLAKDNSSFHFGGPDSIPGFDQTNYNLLVLITLLCSSLPCQS